MSGNGGATGRKIQGKKLELSVLQLRKRGHTYAEIAAACGCSTMGAHKACQRALARLSLEADAETRELRRLQLLRLEHALVKLAPLLEEGQLAAIDRLVRILEHQARLLGLDAPELSEARVELTATARRLPSDEELRGMSRERLVGELMKVLHPAPASEPGEGA